jgi:undecaprenyl diphosphate synthase
MHVAIIMDGNRRWAKKKGKMHIYGYKKGIQAAQKAIKFSVLNRLKMLTLYAFSQENRNRPILEIKTLLNLFFMALDSEKNNFLKYNIKLKVIGDKTYFDNNLQSCIFEIEKITRNNNGLNLNIAANYSGRWDLIQGMKRVANGVKKGFFSIEDITENMFSQFLSIDDFIPVDLVIRTGGEKRLSNFLLWHIAYSELYFTTVLWPDFNQSIFKRAINSFISRNRRFGRL